MQNAHFRHLLHLLGFQTLLIAAVLAPGRLQAQTYLNMPDHDLRPYYFGITLGINEAYFRLDPSSKFAGSDSILVADPTRSAGFNMGLMADLELTRHFDLRLNPTLDFADKGIHFIIKQDSSNQDQTLQSVLVSVPLQLKWQSDRIGNFRVYVLAGGKFDYDLSSRAALRINNDVIRMKPFQLGYEGGFGFEFFFPDFIFSPEIKFGRSIGNIQQSDPNNPYSSFIQRLMSRMIVFSVHLEG